MTVTSPADLLEDFAAASLPTVEATARMQTRVDRKYVIAPDMLTRLLEEVRDSHSVLELDGRREREYRTLYYDTAELTTFRAHVQGRRRRFKVRSRVYSDTGDAFFEVKVKGRRGETIKRRMRLNDESDRGIGVAGARFLADVLGQSYGVEPPAGLDAALGMRYRRITLVDLAAGSRATIDTDLVFDLGGEPIGELAPGYAIVETKSRSGRDQVDGVLNGLGARPVRCSKYCVGVALARPELPAYDFRRLVRRYFQSPLGSEAAA